MSIATVAPTAATGRPRRSRRWVFPVGLGLLAAVTLVLVVRGNAATGQYLDPENPAPDGAKAVAQVLGHQGVHVTIVRSADAFDATRVDDATTVVVTSADNLGASTVERLRAHAGGSRLVLVEPGRAALQAAGVDEPAAVQPLGKIPASCPDPTYADLSLGVDEAGAFGDTDGCFRTPDGALLVEPQPGLVLLGAGQALTNDQVLRADNAALALRTLGHSDRLVWYVPSLDDLTAGDAMSPSALLPRWLAPALWLLAFATVALVFWRGRRLGALAAEPLPVTIRAIETTRSRGRLYRKADDRAHAAAVLREAARRRAAEHLKAGSRPDPAALVRDVARHTGRSVTDVEMLIGPTASVPETDHALVTLANRLAELDREVRRT